MNEVHISFRSEVELNGTLALPENNEQNSQAPAILLLHGSGPVDRDENTKRFKINAFKYLSDELVSHGFAVLRYDKRGIGKSEGNYDEAGLWDLVDDAEAALQFLKNHPDVDAERIYLLGHSEGSMIAAALYKREPVSGIIFVSGAAESLKETVYRQAQQISEDLKQMTGFQGTLLRLLKIPDKIAKQQAVTIKRIEQTDKPVIRIKGQRVQAKWMREHFDYNTADDLEQITCPVLAVTGSKDVQVLPEQAKLFAEKVSGESEYHIIKDMNHLLRKQDEPANMATLKKAYKNSLKKPLEPELLKVIVSWLNKVNKKEGEADGNRNNGDN